MDMLEILKVVNGYIPMIQRTTSKTVVINEREEEVCLLQQQVQPILFGGDQMTVERSRSLQNVLSNSDSSSARLEGLTPVVEDWDSKMCLYKVYCMCLCVCMSFCVCALLKTGGFISTMICQYWDNRLIY